MGGGRHTEEGATLDPLTCYEVTLGSELQLLQEPFLRMRKLQAQAHSGSHGAQGTRRQKLKRHFLFNRAHKGYSRGWGAYGQKEIVEQGSPTSEI